MVARGLGGRGVYTIKAWGDPWGYRRLWSVALVVLLVGRVLLGGTAHAAERAQPFRIGALTESWGPTPAIVGLRDGPPALGYREHEQFDLGVRFTQGELAALPAAARELVQYEADRIFASDVPAAKAAQLATTHIPIVFSGLGGNPVEMGLIQKFARPGANVTGVVNLEVDLGPKRLQCFGRSSRVCTASVSL